MSWNRIGERKLCKGKPDGRRCRVVLWPGAWFWLAGKLPLCIRCAIDAEQHPLDDAPARSTGLTRLRGTPPHPLELNP